MNAADGTLIRIAPAELFGFDQPDPLTFDGSHIWVANFLSNSLVELPPG